MLHSRNLELFRNVAASLAWCITPENSYDIKTVPFFREMMKRTILEGFVRYQYKIDQDSLETSSINKQKQNSSSKTLTDNDDLLKIIKMRTTNPPHLS